MKHKDWPVGVCSWSLRTDIEGVAEAMSKLGVEHIHLAVGPAAREDGGEYLASVRKQGWNISGTMIDFPQEDYSTLESIKVTGGIVPDECWELNRELFIRVAEITAELGVEYLSMHAGFIDESDRTYASKIHERVKYLADEAGKRGIMLLMETGQESADELRGFLEELGHKAIGVNFDPANMILYDKGDPIEAVSVLGSYIKHVHIKDAIRTKQAGTWGTEVPWGEGEVGSEAFLGALERIGYKGALAIEREAGDDRFGDIKLAVERLGVF